jgi:hypothetical protein
MLSSDLFLYRSSLHISCMFSHFLDSAFWALRERLLADLSNNWNYGQAQRKEEPSVLIPETVMISTCSHSCCVYYWLREMSANTGCYFCACTLDSFVTMLNFFAIGLSLSHTPHPLLWHKSQLFPQFWSTLHACICRVAHEGHAGWSVWLILVGIGVIEFQSVKSWKNLAFTVAHHDHQLCALLMSFLVSVRRVPCNLLIGRKGLHVYSSVVKFSILKATEVFSFFRVW